MDAAGNLYGTTGVGGTGGGGTVFKMAPSGAGWTFTLIAASPACTARWEAWHSTAPATFTAPPATTVRSTSATSSSCRPRGESGPIRTCTISRAGMTAASPSPASRWTQAATCIWQIWRGPYSSMLRFLLVEAAQFTVRSLPEWRSQYFHLVMRRGRKIAKVAMARRLAARLNWMMRQGSEYQPSNKFGSYVGQPGHRHGVQ